jgi:hypothetical protein
MAILTTVGDPLPPGVRPLAEVQDRVRSDILNDRTREAAHKVAADALAKGKTLEEAAKALGLDMKKDQALQPGQPIPGSGGKSPEVEKALFGSGVTKGDRGVAPVPAGAVLYEVKVVEHFDAAAFQARKAALREELVSQKKSAMLQALMDRLRQKHQIEINQELVDSLAR